MPGLFNPVVQQQAEQQQRPAAPAAPAAAASPAAGYGVIGGALPFGTGGANMFQGLQGDPATAMANLGQNYATAYGDALAMNQQNYGNILAGYQQTGQSQQAAYGAAGGALGQSLFETAQGYGTLGANVAGTLTGAEASRRQDITDAYAAQRGSAQQSLASRGLGNTTVTDSVLGGIGLDEQKAQSNLANQFATTRAGYQSQIGQAGLGFRGNAAQAVAGQANLATAANTGLAQNQLGFQERVNAGYPNAGMYGQLAQQFGAIGQANADRAQIAALAARRFPTSGTPPQIGAQYVPAGGGFPTPNPGYGGAAGYAGGGGVPGGMGYGVDPRIAQLGGWSGGYTVPGASTFPQEQAHATYDPLDASLGAYGGAPYGDASYGGNFQDLSATVGPGVYGGSGFGAVGGGLGLGGQAAGNYGEYPDYFSDYAGYDFFGGGGNP
jgi:hypothetical protein